MVRSQIAARGIKDPRVLAAMERVPRHAFVPPELEARAYDDNPLPIGYGATISQPYIVALMTELASVQPGERVLDVGTGSGYQAAVLAELGAAVYGIEIVPPLAERAATVLARFYSDRVTVKAGDGYRGWPEHAPFDAILLAAAPEHVPEALQEQLAQGGRLVLPVGPRESQELVCIVRTKQGFARRKVLPVRFVPMVGDAERGAP